MQKRCWGSTVWFVCQVILMTGFYSSSLAETYDDPNCSMDTLSLSPMVEDCIENFNTTVETIGTGRCQGKDHGPSCSTMYCCALQEMFYCYLQVPLLRDCLRDDSLDFAKAKSIEATQIVKQVFSGKFLWIFETKEPNCGLENPETLMEYYGSDSVICSKGVRHWVAIISGIVAAMALLVFGIWCCFFR